PSSRRDPRLPDRGRRLRLAFGPLSRGGRGACFALAVRHSRFIISRMIKNWPLLGVALVAAGCVEAARANNDGAYQGVLELEETVLAFEVGGRLEQLAVDEGDRVEPGALIARLDARLVRAARVARALEAEA